MTDGTYSMVVQFSSRLFAGQLWQNVHLVVFVHLQAHALQFFSPLLSCLNSNKMLLASLYFNGLVSPLLSRNLLWIWDHIISSYLSRLFTYSFKHACFSFLLPHFVQGLKYCDSIISNSSLHFSQWFFFNNIVQNLYVWFSSFPHIKISLSALSSNNLVNLKFIVCNKGFKSFCVCNYQSS